MQSTLRAAFAAALVFGNLGAAAAWAQDAKAVEDRQASMKQQSKDMEAIKAYVDGKAELPAAQAAGADLAQLSAKIPSWFPAGSGMDKWPGKSYAKPVVWSESDKFAAAAKNAHAKAEALSEALKGGDKAAITTAFGELGKNGCGGCHNEFREKKT